MDIFVLGYIGLTRSLELFSSNYELCSNYFSKNFVKKISNLANEISILTKNDNSEEQLFSNGDVIKLDTIEKLVNEEEYYISCSKSLHNALWDMKTDLECGFIIDETVIPIKQETIEIYALLGIDYFDELSDDAYIVCTNNAYSLKKRFKDYALTHIGHTQKGHAGDMVIDDKVRHISRPKKRM